MVNYEIALIEGDGIGPEISAATVPVLKRIKEEFGIALNTRSVPAGDGCLKDRGEALPKSSIELIRGSDACLKAPVGQSAADVIVKLRQMFKLYANIRPARSLPRAGASRPDIDFVIVRENTEDLYVGMEFEIDGGVVGLRLTTKAACERIASHAFKLASSRKKRVVAVHKSNVLRKSDGLFAQVCHTVARRYPDVELTEMLVDATAMNLIRAPETFDVIVTTNLFGDILSDEAAQLVGGLGLAPSANIGDDFALFEPVHGSAPDIAGRGIANPIAMILSAGMMLEWLSASKNDGRCGEASSAVRRAVELVLEKGMTTPDLGGRLKTAEAAELVAREIRRKPD